MKNRILIAVLILLTMFVHPVLCVDEDTTPRLLEIITTPGYIEIQDSYTTSEKQEFDQRIDVVQGDVEAYVNDTPSTIVTGVLSDGTVKLLDVGDHRIRTIKMGWDTVTSISGYKEIDDTSGYVKLCHYNDLGLPDATWVQLVRNDYGYCYLEELPFSSVIIGGYTGYYEINKTDIEGYQTLSLGMSFNSSSVSYVTINNTDVGIDVFNENGAPGTLYTPNATLYTTVGGVSGSMLTAGKQKELGTLSVDTDAHTITQEFIIANTAMSNSPTVIDDCSSAIGWGVLFGTGNISIESNRLKVVGTSSSAGYLLITRSLPLDLSNYGFLCVDMEANTACSARNRISNSSNFKVWEHMTRFALPANIITRYTYPINAPQGATGYNPNQITGTFSSAGVTGLMLGVFTSPDTQVTFYIDSVTVDTAKSAYIELQTPDNQTNFVIQCWNGTAYNTCWIADVDKGTYTNISKDESKLMFMDKTKISDVYGTNNGSVVYPKGIQGSQVTGSNGISYIYTNNSTGALNKIGMSFDLPPSDNGRTGFNKIRLRTIMTENTSHLGTTFIVNNTSAINATYVNSTRLVGYFDSSSVYDAGYSFSTNGNDTYTNWNNTSSGLITLSHGVSDATLSNIRLSMPDYIWVNGVKLNNTSLVYSPNITVGYMENTTMINETSNDEFYELVIRHTPLDNYSDGYVNFTSDGNNVLASTMEYSFQSDNPNASVSYDSNSHTWSISAGSIISGHEYNYRIFAEPTGFVHNEVYNNIFGYDIIGDSVTYSVDNSASYSTDVIIGDSTVSDMLRDVVGVILIIVTIVGVLLVINTIGKWKYEE